MKNLFGKNINSEKFDGSFYIDREISSILENKALKKDEKIDNMEKRVSTPLWFQIIYILLIAFGFLVVCNLIFVAIENNMDFSIPYNNAPGLVIAGVICLVVGILCFIYSKVKAKYGVESSEVETVVCEAEEINNECIEELKIPSDFIKLDILLSQYKKDPEKPMTIVVPAKYICFDMMAFIEKDSLALADMKNVMLIPKDEIVKAYIKKKVTFVNWTKEEAPVKNKYKGYKVVVQNNIFYTCDCIAILINHLGVEYEIMSPIYEESTILKLLNLEIENLDK